MTKITRDVLSAEDNVARLRVAECETLLETLREAEEHALASRRHTRIIQTDGIPSHRMLLPESTANRFVSHTLNTAIGPGNSTDGGLVQ